MEAIKFKHANVEFAKDQDEYKTLPALKMESEAGEVVTCWKLTFFERLKILFTGKLWLTMLTFNKPLTPCFLSLVSADHFVTAHDLAKPQNFSSQWQRILWFFGIAWHNTFQNECTTDFNCCAKVGRKCWWRISEDNPFSKWLLVVASSSVLIIFFGWLIATLVVISLAAVCFALLLLYVFNPIGLWTRK